MRIIFFILFSFPFIAFCDDDIERHKLKLNIQLFDENGSTLNEAQVKIEDENGEEIATFDTDKLGRVYTEELTTWNDYQLTFSKSGYVSKIALIRTQYFYYTDNPDHPGLEWNFQVTLFKEEKGKDYSYLATQPAIIFFFNHLGYQDWNRNYQAKMQLKMELTDLGLDTLKLDSADFYMQEARMWTNYKEIDSAIVNDKRAYNIYPVPFLKKRLEDRIELRESQYVVFDNYVSKADSLFETGKNFSEALEFYQKANKVIRNQYDVGERIYEIELMMFGEEHIPIKSKMESMHLSTYRSLLRDAFAYTEKGEYEEAIKLYKDASEIFPDLAFPKNKIEECKELMAKN